VSARGKRIYRTSMLGSMRLVLLSVVVFFYHDLYLGTFQEEKFLASARFKFMDVIAFHLKYPSEFIWLTCLIMPPFIYYSFIRGVRFFEKGYLFNNGLPFLNTWATYEEIKNYKILAPKSTIALFTGAGDIRLVVDGNIERVIAILDQHAVKGDLAQDAYVKLLTNIRKFVYVVLVFTLVIYAALKMGWFRSIY